MRSSEFDRSVLEIDGRDCIERPSIAVEMETTRGSLFMTGTAMLMYLASDSDAFRVGHKVLEPVAHITSSIDRKFVSRVSFVQMTESISLVWVIGPSEVELD